eukprot:comp21633_c0_seq1/m.30374 comp21633_c0_seq1/g.30374  ORF comp21633_c0_seq1/g.30374 comp21633_c0_seq1/m.30374 type:complete len:527 (+) comp21633_c0_seq1:324-1904(+)
MVGLEAQLGQEVRAYALVVPGVAGDAAQAQALCGQVGQLAHLHLHADAPPLHLEHVRPLLLVAGPVHVQHPPHLPDNDVHVLCRRHVDGDGEPHAAGLILGLLLLDLPVCWCLLLLLATCLPAQRIHLRLHRVPPHVHTQPLLVPLGAHWPAHHWGDDGHPHDHVALCGVCGGTGGCLPAGPLPHIPHHLPCCGLSSRLHGYHGQVSGPAWPPAVLHSMRHLGDATQRAVCSWVGGLMLARRSRGCCWCRCRCRGVGYGLCPHDAGGHAPDRDQALALGQHGADGCPTKQPLHQHRQGRAPLLRLLCCQAQHLGLQGGLSPDRQPPSAGPIWGWACALLWLVLLVLLRQVVVRAIQHTAHGIQARPRLWLGGGGGGRGLTAAGCCGRGGGRRGGPGRLGAGHWYRGQGRRAAGYCGHGWGLGWGRCGMGRPHTALAALKHQKVRGCKVVVVVALQGPDDVVPVHAHGLHLQQHGLAVDPRGVAGLRAVGGHPLQHGLGSAHLHPLVLVDALDADALLGVPRQHALD